MTGVSTFGISGGGGGGGGELEGIKCRRSRRVGGEGSWFGVVRERGGGGGGGGGGVGLGLSRNATSCCKSLGQQRRAEGPLQDGRAPGIFIDGISERRRGRAPRGVRCQGVGAGRALLGPGRG